MSIDTLINRATFELVAAKRQKYVAARLLASHAEDLCTCERRCLPACPSRFAQARLDDAAAEVLAAETAWRNWHTA